MLPHGMWARWEAGWSSFLSCGSRASSGIMLTTHPFRAADDGGSGIGLATAPSPEQLEQQQPAVKGGYRVGYGPAMIAGMMGDQHTSWSTYSSSFLVHPSSRTLSSDAPAPPSLNLQSAAEHEVSLRHG